MFSLINIVGLAVGTLCCLYILMYVNDQYSYDKQHLHSENIYRINSLLNHTGDKHNMATSSPPIAQAIKLEFAEVEQFARVVSPIGVSEHLLLYKEKSFYEKDALFVDSTFFSVFTWHFIYGNPVNALSDPYSVVISEKIAEKLFGSGNPVGEIIKIDNAYGKHDFKITGVVNESLGKSHIHANLFIAMNSGGLGDYVRSNNSWAGNNFVSSYIKLRPDASPNKLEKRLPALLNKYGQEQLKFLGMEKQLQLQRVGTIHTTPGYEAEMDKPVDPSFLFILILIASLIQVIACINFMNLSTARATKRAKEVAVRKVVGASRNDLIKQFLSDSFLVSFLAVLLAVIFLWAGLPYINGIAHAQIKLSLLLDYRIWIILGGLIVFTGIIAGSYPAFYLSAFQAINVMKGNFTNHISATGIRRSLVVFQFILSIVLITGIIIIYTQLGYLKNKDLGFDKEQKIIFNFHTDDAKARIPAFINDLRQLPEIKAVSKTNNYPSQFIFNDIGFHKAGGNAASSVDVPFIQTDENFASSIGLKIISGRDLQINDSGRVLVNETLLNKIGLDLKTAPGTKLFSQQAGNNDKPFVVEIAGVIKDFNYGSLKENIRPFMLVYNPNGNDLTKVIASIASNNYKGIVGKIESVWRKNFASVPFEYAFLDDQVAKQYETEITLSQIINSFTLMAILVSCLGLFGLSAFSADQRRKEIGIRKVLGASIASIVRLLSKDFLKLVLIAFIVAIPIALGAMNKWLQAFAYRVQIEWWMFAIAGMAAVFIALATISFQAIKTALLNPVSSLKTE